MSVTPIPVDPAPTIHVYSKPHCGPCIAVKSHLRKLDLDFVEHDVTTDTSAADRVRALGYLGTPVVEVGDQHKHGFYPAWLDQLARAVGRGTTDAAASAFLEESA